MVPNNLPVSNIGGNGVAIDGAGLREYVKGLFLPPSEASPLQQDLERRMLDGLVRCFHDASTATPVDLSSLAQLFSETSIPAGPDAVANHVDRLLDQVVAHGMHTASPRTMGNMTSIVPYFMASLSKLMVSLNQNLVKVEASRAFSLYERQALAMMHRLVYRFPGDFYDRHVQDSESTLGVLTSGGSTGNLFALWCARNDKLGPSGAFRGVEEEGLVAALRHYNYETAVLIGSSLMHYSVEKAADVLGLGTRSVIKIPVGRHNRIDVEVLRREVDEQRARGSCILAIVGVAGTTDIGSIDPLTGMAEVADEYGIHFHVDAAWGGPVLFSRRHQHKLAGIDLADSVVIDGHKQLYLPIGVGMVLLRSPELARHIEKRARYTIRAGSMDLGRRTLEGSRAGVSMYVHGALQIFGRRGYEVLIDDSIRRARVMADAIEQRPDFELLAQPELNIVVYRYVPAALRSRLRDQLPSAVENRQINGINRSLQRAQFEAGTSFVSRTVLTNTHHRGRIVALRAVLANPLTTDGDVEDLLEEQAAVGAELETLADREAVGRRDV